MRGVRDAACYFTQSAHASVARHHTARLAVRCGTVIRLFEYQALGVGRLFDHEPWQPRSVIEEVTDFKSLVLTRLGVHSGQAPGEPPCLRLQSGA